MNNKPNIFMALDSNFEESNIVVFGAPYDGTVSYRPGTRFAPNAIRVESFGIETYSPYQEKDLEDLKVFDYGDLELPMGNREKALDIIYQTSKKIVESNKIPFMIGGEHLVTLPAFKAVFEKYNDIVLIQFDAHADLRDNYLGEGLSHACVMQRCYQIMKSKELYQFGIRSMTKEEHEFAKKHTILEKFSANTVSEAKEKIKDKPVYITIDLDVLDPSIFSGTGTPEAGGLTYKELQKAILDMRGLKIVGADVNELSPDYDSSKVSTITACKVIREMLMII
ncbi:agmatinase [Brachyspira innocens]|uniref:Agmatinase n=1 Tax=Brachyspira innocens TaxID=13264 RepID=A0ABT8Z0G6_9SPIR|nr:agmatinase [Brachyspira innocens]MDO6994141.1 agmatinase [Brachyspira innocens]MDO7020630.1 agmatinase [Brachyspira innocens]